MDNASAGGRTRRYAMQGDGETGRAGDKWTRIKIYDTTGRTERRVMTRELVCTARTRAREWTF